MTGAPAPWALLAELTHACPLHCPYCSTPLGLVRRDAELGTGDWARVLTEAAALGVVQAHLSGGEPLLRRDLPEITRAAHRAGVHTQLVTSGLGLTARRLDGLVRAGLDGVQLSVQDARPEPSELIAGRTSFRAKERAAGVVAASGLPFGLNVVLHRHNLDRLPEVLDLAAAWGADRIELANAQFSGWALRNRAALLPSRDQLDRAKAVVAERRGRLRLPAPAAGRHRFVSRTAGSSTQSAANRRNPPAAPPSQTRWSNVSESWVILRGTTAPSTTQGRSMIRPTPSSAASGWLMIGVEPSTPNTP